MVIEINALRPIKFGVHRETDTSLPSVRRKVGLARFSP
jgi:hypothetical protein